MNGVIIPVESTEGWTDCTQSGQTSGSAKYCVKDNTIFIYVAKGAGTLSGWTKIGGLPSGYCGLASGNEVMNCAYHNGTNYVNFYINSSGEIFAIGGINNITSMIIVPKA